IKDLLAAKAAQHKLPPQLLSTIAGLESGGKETAANPRSSAKGLFQFTDATWKGMGGKEGEQFDPEKNAELGALFTRQNAEGLKKSLGRNPTYGEVYAAHHFGLKGAKDLMNADPKTPIEMAVSPSVLKANPYLKDKSVGQVMALLNSKTGNGVVTLADGGIAMAAPYYGYAAGGQVKGYANGGQLEVNGSINVNNGNGIGNEVVGANGYTPAGGQPWGGGQYSGQTTAQQAPSTYGQGQPTPSQNPFGTFLQPGEEDFGNPKYQTNSTQPIGSALGNLMNGGVFGSNDFGMVNTNGSGGSTIGNGTSLGLGAPMGPSIQYAIPTQPQGMGSRAFTASPESMGGLKALLGGNTSVPQSQSLTPQFAQGGSVKHYDGTESSLVNIDPMGGYSGNYEAKDTTFDPFQESLASYKKQLEEKIKTKKALEGTSLGVPDAKATTATKAPTDQEFKDFDQASALFEAEQKNKAAPVGIDQAVPKKETGGLDDLIERLNKREAGYGKQKSIDNYMALLSAGLGMMGGTSPHALANIGQGAMMGVQNLGESNKLRAAEQGNLDKTMATALRYKEAQKAANQAREGTLGVRYAELAEKQKTHIANIMSNREKMAQSQAAAYLKANPIAGLNADDPTAVADMANKLLARDPAYLKAYETYNGFGFTLPSGVGGGGNTIRFDAKGNEIK
ncbi:MAG: transglycosylase SLT domain-containing protein, partial [Bacteroidota bacterium]